MLYYEMKGIFDWTKEEEIVLKNEKESLEREVWINTNVPNFTMLISN